ncbi:MAG TPA: multicopper oxidase family protein [Alphaproteobacteria bacterium]|jgi:FtsP/CotA-like multicopper oxidase with cupredoxin domain
MMRPFADLSRRRFLLGTAALAGIAALPKPLRADPGAIALLAKERPLRLPGLAGPSPAWTYGDGWPLELRVPRGETMRATLNNGLQEHTTIHWHGVRVPYVMDGVPYFTQDPVQPGQSFTYSFAPPDPGTYFFHPHCDTLQAMSRGLSGVLVVEDPRDAGLFDVDKVVVLKDWRVLPSGAFDSFTTDRDAARAGTFGNLRTVNGGAPPTLEVPPSARVRLRIVNLDVSRMPMLGVRGANAAVIATDGNACEPFPAQNWRLGPAMRCEIGFQAPADQGAEVVIEDIWTSKPQLLMRIVTKGAAAQKRAGTALKLPPVELPVPKLNGAQKIDFTLQAGLMDPKLAAWLKETGLGTDSLCLNQNIFWSINGKSWPGMTHDAKMPPLAELTSGKSYVFQMFNGSRYIHPMHLHGHTFRVLSSSKRKLPPHWADTVLVQPNERIDIAFVAGEPGDWMFHCHIVDHQDTGMMGYVRVA